VKIACLCPTYNRPTLLQNALACFLEQDYPASKRRLFVLDDGNSVLPRSTCDFEARSSPARYPHLPAKYAALVEMAGEWPDAYAVWEDDDIYLPGYLAAHARALTSSGWSHPSVVWSLYTGSLQQEPAHGRFHAALVISRTLMQQTGGWRQNGRADFDQELLGRLRSYSPPGDPCVAMGPQYVFRWGSTGDYHGQSLMRNPDDDTWWDRVPRRLLKPVLLHPEMDAETRQVIHQLGFARVAIDSTQRSQ